MPIKSIIATLLICTTCATAQQQLPIKQVAAPPSDILSGRVQLPELAQLAERSTSALIPVKLTFSHGVWSWSTPIQLTDRPARIVLLPESPNAWTHQLINERSRLIDPTRVATGSSPLAWIDNERSFEHMTIQPAQAPAEYALSITSDHQSAGYILLDHGPEAQLTSQPITRSTLQNFPISIKSSFNNGTTLTNLKAEIRSPSGFIFNEHSATDTITFVPQEAGPYTIRMIATGATTDGQTVLRTTQHLIDAAPQAMPLEQPTLVLDDSVLRFVFTPDNANRQTILAAEVWGHKDGNPVPITWISTIADNTRTLTLDKRWITQAQADPSTLELRNIRLHDIDTFVPLEIIDRIQIPITNLALPESTTTHIKTMLTGSPGPTITSQHLPNAGATNGPGHRLMLVHGYCTDATPFTISHFSGDLALFEDFEQSRSHNTFALEMLNQAAPMKSFGVVGHSQGGMAALHLYAYYWSGLDWARGNRLIQSVGAPYQGTALAGNAAVLGDIFGFGCGENPDMTYTGSANWLSLIPTWARDDVYYYTTSFEDGFGFDFCNIITDLLLSDPDDGVIERSAGQLPGANNMGHLEGWCHTADMRDPGQCTDQSRNTIMNQEAKR
jgi:hypothetical protein